jgi:hypothetical protein
MPNAEFLHDALRGHRANAFDQARSQIFLDAFNGGRQHLLAAFGFELFAVLRVGDPLAVQAQRFTRRNLGQIADDTDQIGVTARGQAEHGVAVLGVVVGDAFDEAFEEIHDLRTMIAHRRKVDRKRSAIR